MNSVFITGVESGVGDCAGAVRLFTSTSVALR